MTDLTPSVGSLYRPAGGAEAVGGSAGAGAAPGPRVLFSPHSDCAACRAWAGADLAAVAGDVDPWGGRVVHLAPETGSADAERAWLAVVDEWDEVYHVARIGADHAFPDPADVVEWVRFVAIQCPECESPEWPWVTLKGR